MGQAKQRRMAQERVKALFSEIDLARVAAAVQRVCAAASGNLGVDCYDQALLAQSVLQRLGVHAEIVIGYAAWRVGPGGGDVISHYPANDNPVGTAPPSSMRGCSWEKASLTSPRTRSDSKPNCSMQWMAGRPW